MGTNKGSFDVLESLSPTVKKLVDVLWEIQREHEELEGKFFEERAALEVKYQKLYQPLYTKRYEIVNGEADKGVPGFWLTALKNNEVVGQVVSEHDEEVLKYLKDINWSRTDDHIGFKLEFLFDTNPYFKNSLLTKTYHMFDEVNMEKAIGTEIEWYPGKSLTQKKSFFNLFSFPELAAEEVKNFIKQDYDIGTTIRGTIIPHAISWFDVEEEEDDEYDLEDDEDEDDEDIDEDESKISPPIVEDDEDIDEDKAKISPPIVSSNAGFFNFQFLHAKFNEIFLTHSKQE